MLKTKTRRFVWLFLVMLLSAAAPAGCSASTPAPPTPSPTVTPAPLTLEQTVSVLGPVVRAWLPKLPPDYNLVTSQVVAANQPFVVDVRQPEEYKQGFIQGAVNLPLRELVRNLAALPSVDKDIVVVCSSGHQSAIGMVLLQLLGYTKAKTMTGGMQAWQAAKLPVVTQPVPPPAAGQAPKVDAAVRDALDYYLNNMLPDTWGLMDSAAFVEDQAKKSSPELQPQPDHYTQGASILVDVDEPAEFAKQTIEKSINVPLSGMPANLDKIPIQTVTLYP